MKPIITRACRDCLFWNWRVGQKQTAEALGECRRHPPMQASDPKWPLSRAGEWCGEYIKGPCA